MARQIEGGASTRPSLGVTMPGGGRRPTLWSSTSGFEGSTRTTRAVRRGQRKARKGGRRGGDGATDRGGRFDSSLARGDNARGGPPPDALEQHVWVRGFDENDESGEERSAQGAKGREAGRRWRDRSRGALRLVPRSG